MLKDGKMTCLRLLAKLDSLNIYITDMVTPWYSSTDSGSWKHCMTMFNIKTEFT